MGLFRKRKTLLSTVILPRRNRPARLRKRLQSDDSTKYSIGWPSFYALLWILFFGSLPALAFLSPVLHVDELSFSSNDVSIDGAVRKRAEELIAEPAPLTIPGATLPMVWLRRNEMVSTLLREFPVLRSARVDPSFPNTIRIALEFRRSVLMLCSAGPCFLVDDHGTAYAAASEGEQDTSLLRLVDQSGKSVVLGEKVVSDLFLSYAEGIRAHLRDETGVDVDGKAMTPSRLSNELRFRTSEGWELWLDADVPVDRLLLELRTLFAKTLSRDIRASLVYLDLRVPGKVFYRDRGSEETKSEAVEAGSESTAVKTESKEKKKKK